MELRTEEEQVEALKRWWSENGRAVITGLVLGALVIGGFQYWKGYRDNYAAGASELYALVVQQQGNSNADEMLKYAQQLQQEYANSSYAVLAAFVVAKYRVEKADYAAAETALRWAMEHAQLEENAHLARYRLSRVMLEQGKKDEALKLVIDRQPVGYASLYSELQGDIQLAIGNSAAARQAYNNALNGLPASDPRNEQLRIKLNSIAEANTAAGK